MSTSKKHISINKYIWTVLKAFNSSDNPKFLLRLANISKVFRTIFFALLGLVEMPVAYKNHI